MGHRLTAHTGCANGPCPDLTEDVERGKTGGQGYVPPAGSLLGTLPPTPVGEVRWEMDTDVWEDLLAQHLSDAALDRIIAKRRAGTTAA
jgi:hypothetical protein